MNEIRPRASETGGEGYLTYGNNGMREFEYYATPGECLLGFTSSLVHVEIPRGRGRGVRIHQAQVARHRTHVAVSTAVHGRHCGGGGGALVIRPEHAHGDGRVGVRH